MKIGRNSFVSIDYALTLDSGDLVDQSEPGAPLSFIYGAGQIVPGLEKALAQMETGQKSSIVVEAEDGYGRTNLELFQEIPLTAFPQGLVVRPGMAFEAAGPCGPMRFRVKSADDRKVIADFNHPLAGERLHFDVTVVEVRPASPDELEVCDQDCREGCGGTGSCGEGCG